MSQNNGNSRTDRQQRILTLLDKAGNGNESARNDAFDLVYAELRDVASRLMPNVNGHTLQPTALVHEVVIRLLRHPFGDFANSNCFFSVAVDAMQKILIDHYRRRESMKRGGNRLREPLDAVVDYIEITNRAKFESISEALVQLRKDNERQYQVVSLRFFGGLTMEKTAGTLGVSLATVGRDWRIARAKLFCALRDEFS